MPRAVVDHVDAQREGGGSCYVVPIFMRRVSSLRKQTNYLARKPGPPMGKADKASLVESRYCCARIARGAFPRSYQGVFALISTHKAIAARLCLHLDVFLCPSRTYIDGARSFVAFHGHMFISMQTVQLRWLEMGYTQRKLHQRLRINQ